MYLKKNHDLAQNNTLRLSAKADYFVLIHNMDDLRSAIAWCQQKKIALLSLGQGSNVVFTQSIRALVAQINLPGIEVIEETSDAVYLKAGAGVIWNQLVTYCIQHNYFGIENLSLIPGTVGAAPIQNIGAYGVELKDVFVSLTAINQETGITEIFDKASCQFDYRYSIFKEPAYKKYIVCDLTLRLHKHFSPKLDYPALASEAKKHFGESWNQKKGAISANMLSEWVKAIRRSKLPDPKTLPNAGSFFHNPIVALQYYQELKRVFTDMPAYPTIDTQHMKIPAGWLIEYAGWLGFCDASGAGVHDKQALVLVNHAQANGQDIMDLANKIQTSVWEKFAIKLTIEPNVY